MREWVRAAWQFWPAPVTLGVALGFVLAVTAPDRAETRMLRQREMKLEVERDALRRELMRAPVHGPGPGGLPPADLILPTDLPTAPPKKGATRP